MPKLRKQKTALPPPSLFAMGYFWSDEAFNVYTLVPHDDYAVQLGIPVKSACVRLFSDIETVDARMFELALLGQAIPVNGFLLRGWLMDRHYYLLAGCKELEILRRDFSDCIDIAADLLTSSNSEPNRIYALSCTCLQNPQDSPPAS